MTNVNAPDSLAGEWRTAQARLTLAGFRADFIDDDEGEPQLVVSRWAYTKALRSLADVDEFLARVAPRLAEGAAS